MQQKDANLQEIIHKSAKRRRFDQAVSFESISLFALLFFNMLYKSATPKEIAERIRRGEKFKFIDVREPHEYEIARVPEAELMPMSRFNEWFDTLKPEDETVVMCHHGVRSANVCLFLARNGFENVSNLEGGIDLWSATVDENVPRY